MECTFKETIPKEIIDIINNAAKLIKLAEKVIKGECEKSIKDH